MLRTLRLKPITYAALGAALVVPCTTALVRAPEAHASPSQISIMMDDDQLVYGDDNTSARSLTKMKSLGVDTVRVTLLWRVAAELANPTAEEIKAAKPSRRAALRRQKKRFRADNPKTYPSRNWDRYDNLVRKANELGIQIYFNVTGPGPSWAHEKAPSSQRRSQPTWMPKAGQYKRFVKAVGKRYSGTYRDENAVKTALPKVSFWSLWNEPNQAGWLSPQWKTIKGRKVAYSPVLYRKLHQQGYKGLLATGHGSDVILIGETAPNGSNKQTSRSAMRPGKFLRELACVDDKGARYTGSAAKTRKCGGQVLGNGYAHHPYTKNVAPTVRDRNPDTLTMANISDLGTMLDKLSATSGGALPANLPLLMTEFGFESNPPDPFSGVPLAKQADYNQTGEYLGWTNPRISGMAQFLLNDVAPVKGRTGKAHWFTYQSGLFFNDGKPKPAAFAYTMALVGLPHAPDPATGNRVGSFWGQARFLKNGVPNTIELQFKLPQQPDTQWTTLGEPVPVDGRGFYQVTRPSPSREAGQWRAIWRLPSGQAGQVSLVQTR